MLPLRVSISGMLLLAGPVHSFAELMLPQKAFLANVGNLMPKSHAGGAGQGASQEGVAASTQALATAVLDQGGLSEEPTLMRAAAQLYAAAACIGTDTAAAQLMQSICKDMAQTPLPARLILSQSNSPVQQSSPTLTVPVPASLLTDVPNCYL